MPFSFPSICASLFHLCAIVAFSCTPVLSATAQESLTNLQTRSAYGDMEAQNLLGVRFFSGDGIREDKLKAADLFTKAAKQGLAKAQFNLGYMYHNGIGIPQDYIQACIWYKAAANQGHSEAQEYYNSLVPYLDNEKLDEIDRLSSQYSSRLSPDGKNQGRRYSLDPKQLRRWIQSTQPAAGR